MKKKYITNKLDELVICGTPGSEAEEFAKRNVYEFEEFEYVKRRR